jgi:hypothetical protein
MKAAIVIGYWQIGQFRVPIFLYTLTDQHLEHYGQAANDS